MDYLGRRQANPKIGSNENCISVEAIRFIFRCPNKIQKTQSFLLRGVYAVVESSWKRRIPASEDKVSSLNASNEWKKLFFICRNEYGWMKRQDRARIATKIYFLEDIQPYILNWLTLFTLFSKLTDQAFSFRSLVSRGSQYFRFNLRCFEHDHLLGGQRRCSGRRQANNRAAHH